jgi:hypothetical protein
MEPGPRPSGFSWTDAHEQLLEGQLSSIATEIIVAGEMQYREHREWTHKEKIRCREEMRQAEIRRKLEAERAERERLIELEADRLKRLTDSAESYHRAQKIRAFVSTVVDLPAEGVDRARIARWQRWALIQADKLDPIVTGQIWGDVNESA